MIEASTKTTIYIVLCLIIAAYGCLVSTLGGLSHQSADLFALWLAGDFWAMGRFDQIYPALDTNFDMRTPTEWWPYVSATDPDARIFPYLYPPIWAKLMSFLTPITSFAVFNLVVFCIHQILLIGASFLALRMCGLKGATLLMATLLSYAALTLTFPMGIALAENQPQILVSFLIVAAFERAHFKNPRTAGALLALAAAIKLYPVLFVVIFMARRDWRAVGAFAVFGVSLGLLSILLAGWPLHRDYLHLIGILSRSVLVANTSISVDSVLSGLMYAEHLTRVQPAGVTDPDVGWLTMAKTPLWVTASALANLAALGAIAVLAARKPREPLIVPIAAIVLALLSPLSWVYTYMTAFVFLAALAIRAGRIGVLFVGIMVVFFHPATPKLWLGTTELNLSGAWIAASALIVAMGVMFVWVALRRPQMPNNGRPASK